MIKISCQEQLLPGRTLTEKWEFARHAGYDAIELRGRGDVQMYRVELPGPQVRKGIAEDARVRVEMPRSFFNVMAKEAHIADWREAFTHGQAKATGVEQILKLIAHVVEKQEERQRTRRARQ